ILAHPYLAAYHNSDDEPSCPVPCDMSFEAVTAIPQVKRMIIDEVIDFKRLAKQAAHKSEKIVDDGSMQEYYKQDTDMATSAIPESAGAFAAAREFHNENYGLNGYEDNGEPGLAATHGQNTDVNAHMAEQDARALERELAGEDMTF
ncbi:mitogen-activated serine/threonine-protein kinase, partial [Linderina macrospora]